MYSPANYSSIESFLDPKLGPWSVNLYLHRRPILNSIKKAAPYLKGKLLDIGCGQKPYLSLLNVDSYVGVDVETTYHNQNRIDIFFDGKKLPFENETFDSILCTEVLEHVGKPSDIFHEINRVLCKGGYAFITCPMLIEHHEIPWDNQRFTFYGLLSLAKENELDVVFIDDRGSIFASLSYLLNLTISQILSKRPFSDIVYWLLFPLQLLILSLDRFRKKNPPVISLGWQMLVRKK